MIITIDGPTASGKSTVAQLLAKRLHCMHLNSGFLYRAVAYILIHWSRKNTKHLYGAAPLDLLKKAFCDEPIPFTLSSLKKIIQEEGLEYCFTHDAGAGIKIRAENITRLLKTPTIDQAASFVATFSVIRKLLLDFQRELADNHSLIADGRDCGTTIFPHADYKFFLTASLDARAERWYQGIQESKAGKKVMPNFNLVECKTQVAERDACDEERKVDPLKPADDAYIIDSTNMNKEEVLCAMLAIIGKA